MKKEFKKNDYFINNVGLGKYGSHQDINIHNAVLEINIYCTINFTKEMIKNEMFNKKGKI